MTPTPPLAHILAGEPASTSPGYALRSVALLGGADTRTVPAAINAASRAAGRLRQNRPIPAAT
jgi:hypothetical protein